MRIVVVNTAASCGGALSILKDFYKYICNNDSENEWIFLLSDYYIDETENIRVIVKREPKSNWINRLRWELREGAGFINELNPDVVFSMQNTISRNIKSPTLIYLHQAIPFQNVKKFSFFKKEERILAVYQYIIGTVIKFSLKRTNKVIVQTQWMKEEILKRININEKAIIVVKPSIMNIPYKVEEGYLSKNEFFYPAEGAVYKNHKCIIEAATQLVGEGITNFVVKFTLDEKYKDILDIPSEIEGNIRWKGHIPREKVFEEYTKTTLIFPSYIETVGLPLIEAKQVGSIILSSNCNFAKEIIGSYQNGYFFNPFDSNRLCELMKEIINKKIKVNEKLDYKVETNKFTENESWKYVIKEIKELKK